MKSCSWFIIIQRLTIDLLFAMLVKTTIHVIAMTTNVIVSLRAMAVSDVVWELWEVVVFELWEVVVCELWEVVVLEISHTPDVRV